jgi:hypothetical protein
MTFSINPTANKTQAMFQAMAIAQNGTGTASSITGGTSSVTGGTASSVSIAPPAATSIVSSSSGSMVSGTGTINTGGACECACLCGTAAFPNAALQGVAAFGGLSGQ